MSSQNMNPDLPEPDKEAALHSQRMLDSIRSRLKDKGKLLFQQYMQMALFEPGLGYYRCGTEKFGALGDFITAPETSPLFGECLARFCQHMHSVGSILEVGAGSGRLAVSILEALRKSDALPEKYYILELSAELRERQRLVIHESLPELIDRVVWLDSLPEKFSGVVIANEVLDAMPVTRFRIEGNEVYDEYIIENDQGLAFRYEPTTNTRLLARIEQLRQQTSLPEAEEYYSEVNFLAEDWLKSVADCLESAVVVIIDYGYPRNIYYHALRTEGTLLCYYQHRAHSNPLVLPGIQDITAHIDFTALADAALEAGMEVAGFTTQAYFLLELGLLELLEAKQNDLKAYIKASSEVKRLTLPGGMGENFKVMVLNKNCPAKVTGFEQHDMRHML